TSGAPRSAGILYRPEVGSARDMEGVSPATRDERIANPEKPGPKGAPGYLSQHAATLTAALL
ncbi:hypothetical protein MDHKLMBL_20550, partial [Marinobacter flavimaris]